MTLFYPGLEHHESSSSFQDLMPQLAQSMAQSPLTPRKPAWSLRTTSIVKELGQGSYSKVVTVSRHHNLLL